MPYSIRTEPTAEITTLGQVIASVHSRLDGLAEDDPAVPPLRAHLAELTAKRDALTREEEDGSYAGKKIARWVLLFFDLLFVTGLVITTIDLAAGRTTMAEVTGLVVAVVLLALFVPVTFMTWHDVREYRRIHTSEPA